MFKKPCKIKSNTQLKSSEKKKLISKILDHFSSTEQDVLTLFPVKEAIASLKIIVQQQDIVTVYSCQDVPLFYEFEDYFHPTLFALWKLPLMIPSVKVHSGVLHHLLNGADLMIPGIVSNQLHLKETNYPAGSVMYVNTDKNISAVSVGLTLVDSNDMVMPGSKGKGIQIFHTFGDHLCKLCGSCKEIPDLGASFDNFLKEDAPLSDAIEKVSLEENSESKKENPSETPILNMTMDELILYSFLKAIKYPGSEIPLPILTNIFHKSFMLEAVPKNMTLDVKKTKYKKLSVFLTEMSNLGVIGLETNKGVQTIMNVDFNHELIQNFKCMEGDEKKIKEMAGDLNSIEIIEKNVVNGPVEVLFRKYKCKRGVSLSDQEVRQLLTQYVKDENLQDPNSKEFVTLNGPICDAIQTKECRMSWKNLFEGIFKKMGKSYEIHLPDNKVISGKGKLSPIELTVVVKTSNKKVTLVNNLELYGINLNEFSKECQHGVAASSTINAMPNSKSAQFQIQGNQKHFIGRLLLEKYAIPKKYIQGLEEPKSKKR